MASSVHRRRFFVQTAESWATPADLFDSARQVELLAGVDEVGRGPLAGDVVAAAVILDPVSPIDGLRDSKKLPPAKRETLAAEIRDKAMAWALGRASVAEIDALNILQASLLVPSRTLICVN